MKISAVVFDWGGVLIDNPASQLRAYCASYFRVPVKRFRKIYGQYAADFQRGLLTENDLWAKVCARLQVLVPTIPSLWETAIRQVYVEKTNMFSLAAFLKNKGYLIGFLSNTELPALNVFHEHRYSCFDVTVFSCLEGVIKPDPRMYEILVSRLQKPRQEVLLIDDRQENITSARRFGMQAVRFLSFEQIIQDLAKYSLPVEEFLKQS